MKTLRVRVLSGFAAAAVCGGGALSMAEVPVGGATAGATWSSSRESIDGPVLDPAWFGERRVVVYLIPDGEMPAVRGPAAKVFEDRWTAGDWSTKHVFVSDVRGKVKFLAGRRVGLSDLATAVTKAAGQGEQFIESNGEFVRRHVFFVHDPAGTTWTELLGVPSDGDRTASILLLDGGRVVRSIELPGLPGESEADLEQRDEAASQVAGEIRRVLANLP